MRGSGRFSCGCTPSGSIILYGPQSPSLRGSGRFHTSTSRPGGGGRVSIPFIAGQWSLLVVRVVGVYQAVMFQSPSLRGSGRFSNIPHGQEEAKEFQSPSLRGSGRFESASTVLADLRLVSIPFIAGQWSLRAAVPKDWNKLRTFQSPSLRGSGRFSAVRVRHRPPSVVSIPFIAGQWSLPPWQIFLLAKNKGFNPLHCGAVVASEVIAMPPEGNAKFQSPSLRGSGRFALGISNVPQVFREFQSPSLRGSGRFLSGDNAGGKPCVFSFNPLHCGAVVASLV